MEFLRPLLTLCFAALLFLGMLLLFRRLRKNRDENTKWYIQNAEKDGRKVIAYIEARKRYTGDNDASRHNLKKPFQTARYTYFAPDGQKLETKAIQEVLFPMRSSFIWTPAIPKNIAPKKSFSGKMGFRFSACSGMPRFSPQPPCGTRC